MDTTTVRGHNEKKKLWNSLINRKLKYQQYARYLTCVGEQPFLDARIFLVQRLTNVLSHLLGMISTIMSLKTIEFRAKESVGVTLSTQYGADPYFRIFRIVRPTKGSHVE